MILTAINWNVSPEIFRIPLLNFEIKITDSKSRGPRMNRSMPNLVVPNLRS